ncbi:hypothetical protein K0M31_007148 [Melipona bicolor]|uniref:Uncharacterized protein n=1 Tax=Melipona bicolor TaxID=60889 RepID=A0AA40FRQ3_9HYME|nr:hypothetical protein K0M31_007148 [Melipona bicolor]
MLIDKILSDSSDESFYNTMNFHIGCKNKNPINGNINNSQHQQDVDVEEKDNTHVSLETLLRQMFDEILGKSDSAKQTNETDSIRNLNNLSSYQVIATSQIDRTVYLNK